MSAKCRACRSHTHKRFTAWAVIGACWMLAVLAIAWVLVEGSA